MHMTQKAQDVLTRILDAFETGNVPEALARTMLPQIDVPCNRWSLSNRLLVFLSGTQDARGIQQWRDVGRWPKKGSRAFHILVPLYAQRKKSARGEDAEEKPRFLVGFGCCPVFRLEDTEGASIPTLELEPPEPPPLIEVASAWGIDVRYLLGNGSYFGFFSPGQSHIGLSTYDVKTFFHELAHAAYHRVLGALRPGQDWRQEVVAELTAATLMHLYGEQPDDGGAYLYIRRYAAERLARLMAEALEDVHNLDLYRTYCRRFPASVILKAYIKAKETAPEKIKKSRGALFNFLVQKYGATSKPNHNPGDQAG